jgi:hypothetical protein
MSELIVADVSVRQDSEGRYCLNDLHKAAGGEEHHAPNRFTRSEQFIGLMKELTPNLAYLPMKSKRGSGTFVCKELVYSYAMWISPKFHLKVIRAYDTLQTQGIAVAEHAAQDVLQNPIAYMKKIILQAEELQAQKEQLEKVNMQVTGERDTAVKTIAKVGRTVTDIARRIPNVNVTAISKTLFNLGYYYKSNASGSYRVYRKYSHLFVEQLDNHSGYSKITVTEAGIKKLLELDSVVQKVYLECHPIKTELVWLISVYKLRAMTYIVSYT